MGEGLVIGCPFFATAESAEIAKIAKFPRDVPPRIRDYLIVSIAPKGLTGIARRGDRSFTWSFDPNERCRATRPGSTRSPGCVGVAEP
jgi:hypothetical protein